MRRAGRNRTLVEPNALPAPSESKTVGGKQIAEDRLEALSEANLCTTRAHQRDARMK